MYGSLPGYLNERDACGIGFVAHRQGKRSHQVLQLALAALANHVHRGAVADDGKSGDGAGILTQIPDLFFRQELDQQRISMPPTEDLAVGMLFLSRTKAEFAQAQAIITRIWQHHGGTIIGWRNVPVNTEVIGERAITMMPRIVQVFLRRPADVEPGEPFERLLFLARRQIEKEATRRHVRFYAASFSSRTLVYKGLVRASSVAEFYPDLRHPAYRTAIALFHQRYSTNTFPTWERAQPFRLLCHNGEINTLQGNITWMHAREADAHSPLWGENIEVLKPFIDQSGSDSAMLDNALELLVRSGRDIRHSMLMLIPEAWEHLDDYAPERRAFYHYHAMLMEPWDGPAAVSFTDGQIVGTLLDRNGLRPARYVILKDGLVISASEAGSIPVAEHHIEVKGRLGPGQMIALDTRTGQVMLDEEVTRYFASRQPYQRWLEDHLIRLPDIRLPKRGSTDHSPTLSEEEFLRQQIAFGWVRDDWTYMLQPMIRQGKEPIGAMGDDTPISALSDLPRPLFHAFRQRFAEVTNPPIDPLREELVMSLTVRLGRRENLLQERPEAAQLLELHSPILRHEDMARIEALNHGDARLRQNAPYRRGVRQAAQIVRVERLSTLWPVRKGPEAMQKVLETLCVAAEAAVRAGATILVLSDKGVSAEQAPLPSLLATAAVHHHLLQTGLRMHASIIVETGEVRETHHVATLIGYGASAVYPYLALEAARYYGIKESRHDESMTPARAEANLIHGLEKGLFKIMSKMGISTLDAYTGAQIFQSLGLTPDLVEHYFPGTPNLPGHISLHTLAETILTWHQAAFAREQGRLDLWGLYKPRRRGEVHQFTPQTAALLHQAVRTPDVLGRGFETGYRRYRMFSQVIQDLPPRSPHHLLKYRKASRPVPVQEVEPVEHIVQRFSTAAISHGALGREAHETLAIAMNRLAAMAPAGYHRPMRAASNSGEGGEDPYRYGTARNSAIKQVASGRFGVTAAYLMSARELQIKMAQGSKPGEGGHLPGHKVTQEIARLRYATPGTPLISPPPHHDIYSIEDLAQLIFDLKQINPQAAVSVKLVAQAGVGTIAAGVAKGHTDVILISGATGGTGASPLSSIKNTGVPWELGLVEAQHTLVANGLRGRVRLRVDGGLVTGRDVVIAALLGADEFSFGTVAMIAEGCIMARVCHQNTCPVGVATQRPDLRAKFPGKPEQVMAYFLFVAQEVREILAELGYRSLDEIIGHTELLTVLDGETADRLDVTSLLVPPEGEGPFHNVDSTNPLPDRSPLGDRFWEEALTAVQNRLPRVFHYPITNVDRTVGARLAGEIAQTYGEAGLPEGTITAVFHGSAGQSFGAFNVRGMHLYLIGEANDYVGKGMSGGELVLRPSYAARYESHRHVILGNTALYGATGGALYAAGRAGERFAVRNSGVTAVVEGVGDHGCEYMTGGVVVVLGETGRNFAAGMTGGRAYVYDPGHTFLRRLNRAQVVVRRVPLEEHPALKELVRKHYEKTGSVQAALVLRHWPIAVRDFWQVLPRWVLEQEGQQDDQRTPAELERVPLGR